MNWFEHMDISACLTAPYKEAFAQDQVSFAEYTSCSMLATRLNIQPILLGP